MVTFLISKGISSISEANAATAAAIGLYPVQRQTLPSKFYNMSFSDGC